MITYFVKPRKVLAEQLQHKAGVALRKCGIEEDKKFQAVLLQYQIHVLSKDHFNGLIYDGVEGGVSIHLYYHYEHLDAITKMTGFLIRSYFCDTCKKGYDHKERHVCNNPCVYCHKLHSNERQTRIGSCVIIVTDGLRMNCALKCILRRVVT